METEFLWEVINKARAIPNVIAIAVFVSVAGSCRTGNLIHSPATKAPTLQDSLLTDTDGNKYPIKVLLDGKLWMTTNLNLNVPNSYCYENVRKNCEQYGHLYIWESARQGCVLLGEGWRLPTNGEWRQLIMLYGGVAADSNLTRKVAYKALLYAGTSGFGALLGGGRAPDNQYSRLDAHGFYWSATEIDNGKAWFYNFAKGSQALYQQDDGEKTRAFSVRCVKNIDSLK